MPFDIHTRTAGLATDAFAQVTAFFAETSHRPSQEQWDAIRGKWKFVQMLCDLWH